MAFQKRREIWSAWVRGTGLAVVVLASLLLWTGCVDTSEQVDQPSDDPGAFITSLPALGQAGLNSRIFHADLIIRARLISTNATAENIDTDEGGSTAYRGMLEFKFRVLEYLKGTGGGEFVVFVTDQRDRTYSTMELALEASQSWDRDRNTQWDQREALIFAENPAEASGQATRYSLGYGYVGAYGLDSKYRVWLPSVSSSASGSASSGDLRFLLEEPGGGGPSGGASGTDSGQPETISVSEMKALIVRLENWIEEGEGVEGHIECIRKSFTEEARINGHKERGESLSSTYDFYLGSGLPAGTVMHETLLMAGRWWLLGKDKVFFAVENGALHVTRPLPAGKYRYNSSYQSPEFIPCDYHPDEYKTRLENIVTVTAPAGTLHEAFFDPVTDGSAVAADSSNGVLKPAAFTDANNASATIQRIEWDAGTVKVKVSSQTGLAGQTVDIVELDGSVSLSLDVDNATVEAANNTLSWAVASQPWHDGDKLMVRIRVAVPASEGVSVSLSEDTVTFSWSAITGAAEYRAGGT